MSRDLFLIVFEFCQKNKLLKENSTIILGFSGGPDSLFLLYFFLSLRTKLNLNLVCAHLDHQWRLESGQDAQFCSEIARVHDVEFRLGRAQDLSSELKFDGSKEELGRRMRREFLESLAREYAHKHSDVYIALGHHKQDQQENFFIRLIRGTTLSGLIGMRPKQNYYIRPLLNTSKSDILNYLELNGIAYLTDPTNESFDFLRNRIRHNLLPPLRECDSRFDANFFRTLSYLTDAEDELVSLTNNYLDTFIVQSSEKKFSNSFTFGLNFKSLFTLSAYMQKRVLLQWLIKNSVSFTPQEKFLEEILRFLHQIKSSSHQIHHDWKLVKEGDIVFVEKNKFEF